MAVNNLNTPGVGIQPSLIDAKGDLLVGTGNDAIDRLGVTGPTGSVLVTDAGETTGLKWVDPGTVGGLVHIKQVTGSGVSAINVDDVFSATYTNYKVIFNLTSSTSPTGLDLRLRVSGSDNASTNYREQRISASSTTVSGERLTGQTKWRNVAFTESSLTGTQFIEIANPFQTANTSAINFRTQSASGNIETTFYGFGIDVTTSYTGFTLFPNSGTITGTVNVYGYKLG